MIKKFAKAMVAYFVKNHLETRVAVIDYRGTVAKVSFDRVPLKVLAPVLRGSLVSAGSVWVRVDQHNQVWVHLDVPPGEIVEVEITAIV